MSLAEVKAEIKRMSAVERAEVERQLRIMRWADSADLSERLAAAHAAMDSGMKIGQDELEALIASQRKAKA